LHATSRLKTFYLTHLAKPASDRIVYKAILREGCRRIVELGVGNLERAQRMIEAAAAVHERASIHFTGIDPFEDRGPSRDRLTLIDAHRQLRQSGAKIKLLPGEPCESLARAANALGTVDLLLISAMQEPERLERLWFFIPRLLHEGSLVFLEEAAKGAKTLREVDRAEVAKKAARPLRRAA
jgi:hypothetical protein